MTTSQGLQPVESPPVLSSAPPKPPVVEPEPVKEEDIYGIKSWEEFRNTGLLFYINQILHVFGWAITVIADEEGKVEEVFPHRVKYRGFTEDSIDRGYKRVAEYLKNNADTLHKEIQ